jgi:hypothetical protein
MGHGGIFGWPPKPAWSNSKPWVTTQTGLAKFKVKTLGCHPNWPEGAPIAAPLQNPRLLKTAATRVTMAVFQVSQ